MLGDSGNDTFIGAANVTVAASLLSTTEGSGLGDDFIVGGDGVDTVDYRFATTAINVNLAISPNNVLGGISTLGIASGTQIGLDTLIDVENIIGGSGDDTYRFANGGGADTIVDFNAGAGSDDNIDLRFQTAATSLAQMQATPGFISQNGANTLINFGGGDTLTLNNITMANLHADDFLF